MTQSGFQPTLKEKTAVALAYLAYTGEELIGKFDKEGVEEEILTLVQETLPKLAVLCEAGEPDWKVVWGPAIYTFPLAAHQDNGMFVVQRISRPHEYTIAIRGTNGVAIMDWLREDLSVWRKVDWQLPAGVVASGNPKVSKATSTGVDALLNRMSPKEGLPGASMTIASFLTDVASSGRCELLFTGHSLAGCLAPTLALHFCQSQGLEDSWDPASNATVSTISFAGPSAGNSDFAAFSDAQLGPRCDRIFNTLDIVPAGWASATLKPLPHLYVSGGIKMGFVLKLFYRLLYLTLRNYRQISKGNPFTWEIQPEKDSYLAQAAVQHFDSYPNALGEPEILEVLRKKASPSV